MHILPIVGFGGIESLMVAVLRALPSDRFALHCCSLYASPDVHAATLRAGNVETHWLGAPHRGSFDPAMILRLAALLRRLRIDICHTHNIAPEIYGHVAALGAKTPILIHHEHSTTYNDQFARRLVKRALAGRKDRWIAVSQYVRGFLIDRVGVPERKIAVIYNGLPAADPEGSSFPAATGFQVGTVARLSPEKGIEYLIEAWPHVQRSVPDATLKIVGDGVLGSALKRRAQDLGIGRTVEFLGYQEQPERHLRGCSIFVLPSLNEGFGLALLEAMRDGKAVIASRVGGIPELVEDGRSGVLVRPGDSAALGEAIVDLLTHEERRLCLAREGREVARHFTLERTVRHIGELYEELVRTKLGLAYSSTKGGWLADPR